MKLAFLIFFLAAQAFADAYSVVVAPGTTNITANYNTTNRITTGFAVIQDLTIENAHATARLYVSCSSAGTPSDATTSFFQVGPGGTLVKTNINLAGTCYYKSSSGTISSGNSVYFTFWGPSWNSR